MQHFSPDKTWSLFLDRDGVINERYIDQYVLKPADFKFIDEVQESMAWFSEIFGIIVVVTNQQGIGKGMMTEADLDSIHQKMATEIKRTGGRIDKIYHCPALREEFHFCRKPAPGMALRARKDFPQINFKRSVMVGDTLSDMQFGKKLKMTTVFINKDKKLISQNDMLIDYCFSSLWGFKEFLDNKISL